MSTISLTTTNISSTTKDNKNRTNQLQYSYIFNEQFRRRVKILIQGLVQSVMVNRNYHYHRQITSLSGEKLEVIQAERNRGN